MTESEQPESKSLEQQLLELKELVNSVEQQSAELATLEQSFQKEKKAVEEEYRQRIYNLNEANAQTHYAFQKVQKELERVKAQEESLTRQLEQKMAAERAENEFLTLENRWMALTANAKWREYAKPHQVSGAQRIAFIRRMILADTVGLGKTLTAGVAAADLIKAATAEGDSWTETMTSQGYHTQNQFCAMNGCRETEVWVKPDGFRSTEFSDGAKREMYGRCEIIHSGPPAGRRILYICPVALVRNVQAEYRKWSGAKTPITEQEVESSDVDTLLDSILNSDSPVGEIESSTPTLAYVQNPDPDSLEITTRMTVNLSKTTKTARRYLLTDVLQDQEEFVVIINYEAWRKDSALISDLVRLNFDTVIIDEAHNVKDRASIAYRGVRAILDGTSMTTGYNSQPEQIADPIRFVIPMTGTPILNKPQELYSMLTLVDPRSFPNDRYYENRFLRDYCIQDYDTQKWTFRAGGVDALLKKFGNRILRRDRKMAGIITPPQEVQYHEIEIDEDNYADQCKARDEMRKKAMIILDPDRGEAIVASHILALYTRLRQIETWPDGIQLKDRDGQILLQLNIKQSQKLDYVIKYDPDTKEWDGLLPEVCPSERTVIFSQFNGPLDELAERAKAYGLRVGFIRGGQSDQERNEIRIDADRYHDGIENYQTKFDLLLINYKAGGVGLNLNDFTQTIILDEEWNPGKRDQAYGRTDRMGQTEETTVHVIRMNNTIDSWMAALIEFKESMTSGFDSAVSAQSLREGLEKGEI